MDVLDHSCSKLGFGGKMCIDGTWKFEEERDESGQFTTGSSQLAIKKTLQQFSEIKIINASLPEKQIPVLIISVEKNRRGHIRELHQQICGLKEIEGVKMILYVEHTVDANDLPVALWRFCNNLDPKRDHILVARDAKVSAVGRDSEGAFACIGFDGTIKTKEFDNFQREWPNIIVSNDETISAVDAKWNRLGLGEFIPSPSLKYKEQMYGEEAVVKGK